MGRGRGRGRGRVRSEWNGGEGVESGGRQKGRRGEGKLFLVDYRDTVAVRLGNGSCRWE